MGNGATKATRENRTITVDLHDESTYFQLMHDGTAFVEFVLAFVLSIGFQLAHQASCTGGSATQVMLATRFRATVRQKQTQHEGDQQQPCASERHAQHVDQASTRKMVIPATANKIINVRPASASLGPRLKTTSFRMSGAP